MIAQMHDKSSSKTSMALLVEERERSSFFAQTQEWQKDQV
jgi:hypothetical protein